MRDLIGFALVIISAFPMGVAEGKIIQMDTHYTLAKITPTVFLYLVGFSLYLLGFMLIPSRIGFIIGVWEISAVIIGVTVAISKNGTINFDRDYLFLFALLVLSTYILGWTADRILSKAGI